MIFEFFHSWDEEKLGLIGGICFVIMGILYYLLYLMDLPLKIMLLAIGVITFSALTALFFQLPRIRKIKPGISTFVGGIMLGIAIISWGYILTVIPPSNWAKMGEVAALSAGLLVSSFFGFGFLLLALIPPHETLSAKSKKRGVKEFKEEEDFIDRL